MEQLIQHLPGDRREPRLWFEKLSVFSEPDAKEIIRTISFRRGMNVVWAKEPVTGDAIGVHAAGHGVGKTSLCLLLRFCLGDPSKAVGELRDELHSEFPKGGVLALVHIEGRTFTLCRHFNPRREGFFLAGSDMDGAWDRDAEGSDRDFLDQLAGAMMAPASPGAIPDTGQEIQWRHILAWISRDQGSRFKSFFSWREDEGSGLQRSRQDPPVIMRAALGLMDQSESLLMTRIATLEQDLERAKQEESDLRREPELIRRRIESNLRARGGLPENLPIRTEGLFGDSVERRALLDELVRWEGTAGSDSGDAAISAAQNEISRIGKDLASARTQLTLLRQDKSAREKALAALTDALTHCLLPDGAYGSFDSRDEERPFRLSMRGGEAYRVLEVLLGDVACMLDSANTASALPGLLIHDCPREADLSIGLYQHFLSLVDELEAKAYAGAQPAFQYIVTTTTPPPANLRDGAICLTLEPTSDEGLLFRRRFGSGQKLLN